MKNSTLLKQTLTLYFASSTVLFAPLAANALTVEEVTNPRRDNVGWVSDMADILSNSTEAELNSLITNLEQNNGAEIAVVTVPETAPADSPKTFATQLFNYWGIGKAESNNGILFLVSIGDKRVEIETGKGIANTLTDAKVAHIIDTKITPQYKHDNFDRGTLNGTKALISTLQPLANVQTSSFAAILIIILVIWLINALFSNIKGDSNRHQGKKRKRKNSSSQSSHTQCNHNSYSDGSSFFSSSSSSSGSPDFGGGSSDGGGAGGDF